MSLVIKSAGKRRIWPSALRLLKELNIVLPTTTTNNNNNNNNDNNNRKVLTKEDVIKHHIALKGSTNTTTTAKTNSIEQYRITDTDSESSSSTQEGDGEEKKKKVFIVNNEFEDVLNSPIRKVIATRLLASKRSQPHSYITMDVDATAIDKFRKKAMAENNVKVSVNDLILYAASKALQKVRKVNSRFDEKTGTRVEYDTVDISVAVAAPSGLVTPIVFNADAKTVSEIGQDVRRLAQKAKEGKLKPSEMIGGSFTISNLGMFPVDSFQAIQNPPQGAILAIGRGTERVVLSEKARAAANDSFNDESAQRTFSEDDLVTEISISATLSIDNRIMDESDASEWLEAFASELASAEETFAL